MNTLDVISRFPRRFKVSFLSTNTNVRLLGEQARKFKPEAVGIIDVNKVDGHRWGRMRVYGGEEGLCRAIEERSMDILVVAIVGARALLPILTGLKKVKRIALANKEALVMAGNIIMEKARKHSVEIIPIDSEHSAIFQCIGTHKRSVIKKIYLTGSGGPLLNLAASRFKYITPLQATSHPKWKMGKKISVDSSTLMNKGLEVIEAHWLFGMDVRDIEVLVHPEAIIHSMVEFIDGSIVAQLGICDMRLPIQYALTYPHRCESPVKRLEFSRIKNLHFQKPDLKKFLCLKLAYEAAKKGGTLPCVLNAANEIAVGEFLKGKINLTDIPKIIEKVLKAHRPTQNPDLKDVLEADEWAREITLQIVHCRKC